MKKLALVIAAALPLQAIAQSDVHPMRQTHTGSKVQADAVFGDYEGYAVSGQFGFLNNHAVNAQHSKAKNVVDIDPISFDYKSTSIGYKYGGENLFVDVHYNVANDLNDLAKDYLHGSFDNWGARVGYEFDLGNKGLGGNNSTIWFAYSYEHYKLTDHSASDGAFKDYFHINTISAGSLETFGNNDNWYLDSAINFNFVKLDSNYDAPTIKENFFEFRSSVGYLMENGVNASFNFLIDNAYGYYSGTNFAVGLSLGYNF